MFLLLGAVYVHHLPQLLTQLGFDPLLLDTNTPVHILVTVAVLTLPGAAAAATDGLMRLVAGELLPYGCRWSCLYCDTLCCTMLCCTVLCWQPMAQPVLHCRKGHGMHLAFWLSSVLHHKICLKCHSWRECCPDLLSLMQLSLIDAGRASDRPKLKPFLETSYSYMPLVWGATLAFWSGPALQEGGHILPVSLPLAVSQLLHTVLPLLYQLPA